MSLQVATRADSCDKHTADVNTLIYHQGKLYSGADDGKIIAWKDDLTKICEVRGHPATVYSLAAIEDTLYSCSDDGKIKAWHLGDLKSEGTLIQLEDDEIYQLFTKTGTGTLYSSDVQGIVRQHEGKVVKNSFHLMEPLKDIMVIGDLLYTVRNLDVIISEMGDNTNFEQVKTIMGRAPMCTSGDYLCFISRSGKDILIHENKRSSSFKQVAEVKEAHDSRMPITALAGIKSGDSFLYSAGWDKVVKKWKIQNGSCTLVNSCNVDMVVNVLAYGEKGEMYAGGSDGQLIKIDM